MSQEIKYSGSSDSELVYAWQNQRDESALNTLVTRHYPIIFKRIRVRVRNPDDAQEITQDVFIKLIASLDKYTDEGKFPHFLSSVASSQLVDFYRKSGKDPTPEELDEGHLLDSSSPDGNPADKLLVAQKVEYLTEHCIPQLPAPERLVFLLMHESEFWDFESPLEWSHIATLNGVDKKTAWERFESAREALMKGTSAGNIDTEELLIFLVWTEAKRLTKAHHTLSYFANLLGEAEQNLRNRSHKAKKRLDECLESFVEA